MNKTKEHKWEDPYDRTELEVTALSVKADGKECNPDDHRLLWIGHYGRIEILRLADEISALRHERDRLREAEKRTKMQVARAISRLTSDESKFEDGMGILARIINPKWKHPMKGSRTITLREALGGLSESEEDK